MPQQIPPVRPRIDPAVMALAPDFHGRSITALLTGPAVADAGSQAAAALDAACDLVRAGGPDWAEAHIAAWRDAFRGFGAKPARTPSSAEALRKRVLRDGTPPSVNPIVDLYNAVSLRHAVPVGGENLDAYQGTPRLIRAAGTETFDMMKDGAPATETPEPGEVVWCDDAGVTCRRWNWRQGIRTRLEPGVTRMWFILEALGAMPPAALAAAADDLAAGIARLWPGAVVIAEPVITGGAVPAAG
ncbi:MULTISPECIES: B3/B4 domain-containing protein [Tistrella]|uniref:Phenylalanine--tRNA ligase beta subunit-related protein n=1 Tax=Tistrella arctica TaxID=3133430 RepID=A0ABU9YND9_9PROT